MKHVSGYLLLAFFLTVILGLAASLKPVILTYIETSTELEIKNLRARVIITEMKISDLEDSGISIPKHLRKQYLKDLSQLEGLEDELRLARVKKIQGLTHISR